MDSPYDTLGLAYGESDPTTLRRAYAAALRAHPPEDDPVGFRRIRDAYEWVRAAQREHAEAAREAEAEAEAEARLEGDADTGDDPARGSPQRDDPEQDEHEQDSPEEERLQPLRTGRRRLVGFPTREPPIAPLPPPPPDLQPPPQDPVRAAPLEPRKRRRRRIGFGRGRGERADTDPPDRGGAPPPGGGPATGPSVTGPPMRPATVDSVREVVARAWKALETGEFPPLLAVAVELLSLAGAESFPQVSPVAAELALALAFRSDTLAARLADLAWAASTTWQRASIRLGAVDTARPVARAMEGMSDDVVRIVTMLASRPSPSNWEAQPGFSRFLEAVGGLPRGHALRRWLAVHARWARDLADLRTGRFAAYRAAAPAKPTRYTMAWSLLRWVAYVVIVTFLCGLALHALIRPDRPPPGAQDRRRVLPPPQSPPKPPPKLDFRRR